MKRTGILLFLIIAISISSMAQKDINAWKNENNLQQQYTVFKENLNFWNGSYFLKETQMDEFYGAFKDSIANLEEVLKNKEETIVGLRSDLNVSDLETKKAQQQLNDSIKNQNAISLFGINLHKNIYTLIMSSLIIGLLVLLVMVFFMFKKSNSVTVRTKNEYAELKNEFEVHKKNALERYTKMNTELHKTRMELNKR